MEVMEEAGFAMSMAGRNWEITVDFVQSCGKIGTRRWVQATLGGPGWKDQLAGLGMTFWRRGLFLLFLQIH